jgi:hypothetical protein
MKILNDNLELSCHLGAVAFFKVLSQHLLGGTEKNNKKPTLVVSGRFLNPERSEYSPTFFV